MDSIDKTDKASSLKKDIDFERKASQKKSVFVTEDNPDDDQPQTKEIARPQSHFYAQDINAEVEYRMQFRVTETVDGEEVDLTPNYIPESPYADQFIRFNLDLKNDLANLPEPILTRASTAKARTRQSMRGGVGGNKQSIDEIINGIMFETIAFDTVTVEKTEEEYKPTPFKKSFVKVTLRKSEFIELHSQISSTVPKGTPQGDAVEADNKLYEYLTVGKGKVRRRADNDAQTTVVLTNTRAVNTIFVDYATVGSYVSNFEMYDTLHGVAQKTKFRTMHSMAKVAEVQTQTRETQMTSANMGEEELRDRKHALSAAHALFRTHDFISAIRIIGRTLSSNQFYSGIERFRNFRPPDRCALDVQYKYSMKVLFRLIPALSTDERKAVSDISFCTSNSDILAIGYGLFSFSSQQVPVTGEVYVWSVKNPGEPERTYYFDKPVTAVCFSPYLPSLIAIGMYDGSVEVRDVADMSNMPIAVSERSTSPSCSPVVAIRWIKQEDDTDGNEIDPFLSLSQDGSVTRYHVGKSPYLLGFTQMTLERIEGHPEGIRVPISPTTTVLANRHPQGLYITTHPIYKDIYYILTDEGCIHKCSINYQHQYLEVLKCHDGGVNVMEFSPWSPKLFLTCGNDWYVRIWVDGITRPIIELLDDFQPVHWAKWSPTHSTIIVSVNRNACSIWDLRRNILKPMGKFTTDSSFNTIAEFSNSGTVLVVGNERGNAIFEALNDMPFAPHFQYDELEKAIYRVIGNDQELFIELKSIGFFGYPNKECVKP